MSRMPHYVPAANMLDRDDAEAICGRFEDGIERNERLLKIINDEAQVQDKRHGMYPNAEYLFFAALYDEQVTGGCESQEASRNEERFY